MKKIFIDTDLNFPSDDFQALMIFLANDDVDIVGIGATAGNTWSEEVFYNIHRAFAFMNLQDEAPPVFRGPPASDFAHDRTRILGDTSVRFTGAHGKASAPRAWVADDSRRTSPVDGQQDAVQAIIDLSHRYPGELIVVCLGPLTNLAQALGRDPSVTHRIRDVAVMGGCFSDDRSAKASIDFNFLFDPTSAEIVLDSGLAVRLFPLDLCRRARCTPELVERLAQHDGGWADVFVDDFLASIRQHGVSMALTDQLVAIAYDQADLVLAEERCRVAVGPAYTANRGLTTRIPDPASRVTVVQQVDAGRVHDRLVTLVGAMRWRELRPFAIFSTPAYTYFSGLRLATGPFGVVDVVDRPGGYELDIRDVLTADELSRIAGEFAELVAVETEGAPPWSPLSGSVDPLRPRVSSDAADTGSSRAMRRDRRPHDRRPRVASADNSAVSWTGVQLTAPNENRLSRKHGVHAIFEAVTSARAAITVRSADGASRAITCLSVPSDSRRDLLRLMLEGALPENAAVAELWNGPGGISNVSDFDCLDARLHAWYCRSMQSENNIVPLFLILWDREAATLYELTTHSYEFVARHKTNNGT